MKDKFNENLREARLRKKLTQQQVADKLGIAKSTYCQYETGASEPNVLRLKELARILETTGDALLGRTRTRSACIRTYMAVVPKYIPIQQKKSGASAPPI